MSLKSKVRPPFSFDTWGLLCRAVFKFNDYQEQIGGEIIYIIPYLKVGKKYKWHSPFWVLRDFDNKNLEKQWENFISNPDNRVLFTKEQLYGEEYL
ncbi:MAG TPA: hypothetical protein PLX95_03475 [bacterium]|nr:hypothetical protein [bacterium]